MIFTGNKSNYGVFVLACAQGMASDGVHERMADQTLAMMKVMLEHVSVVQPYTPLPTAVCYLIEGYPGRRVSAEVFT